MTYTVADLIREVRKPGKMTMTVPTAHDMARITIDKSDLLLELAQYDKDETAPWIVVSIRSDGARNLDLNS